MRVLVYLLIAGIVLSEMGMGLVSLPNQNDLSRMENRHRQSPQPPKHKVKKPSLSGETYRQGYRDGCQSARGTETKSLKAYQHSAPYRRGWDQGFGRCKPPSDKQSHDDYRRGFDDGCRTAGGHYRKDKRRYRNNRQYRRGWESGRRHCIRPDNASGTLHLPDDYRRGYRQGCRSARDHFRQRDPVLYRNNREYRRGWQTGKQHCTPHDASHRNAYRRGEDDGCQSARGHWEKNERDYRHDPLYRKGWDRGYRRCGTPHPDPGYYFKGYHDGCLSARGDYRKDNALYRRDVEYRRGWNEGNRECQHRKRGRHTFEAGYRDGCRSAQGYYYRDDTAYRLYTGYRRGWNEGYRTCHHETIGNDYWRGYRDGCRSGQGHWHRDPYAYSHFVDYRRGWNLGREECGYWNIWSLFWQNGGLPNPLPLRETHRPEAPTRNEEAEPIPLPPVQVSENPVLPAIRRMTESARSYLLAHYLKFPSGERLRLELSRLNWMPGYGMVEGVPRLANGAIPSPDIIDNRRFLFCLKQNRNGEWILLYDLSYPVRPTEETLVRIRQTFPEDFPHALLPREWQILLDNTSPSPPTSPSEIENRP